MPIHRRRCTSNRFCQPSRHSPSPEINSSPFRTLTSDQERRRSNQSIGCKPNRILAVSSPLSACPDPAQVGFIAPHPRPPSSVLDGGYRKNGDFDGFGTWWLLFPLERDLCCLLLPLPSPPLHTPNCRQHAKHFCAAARSRRLFWLITDNFVFYDL